MSPIVALSLLLGCGIVGFAGWQSFWAEGGDDYHVAAPPPGPVPPKPEPVSTVPPRVKGWKAVSSDKYRLTYDVPKPWKVNSTGLLIGFEDADGKPLAAMSATAEYRAGRCGDEPVAKRAAAGFNQYVDGTVAQVAEHAAYKWAKAAYTPEEGTLPKVTVSRPRPVRAGRLTGQYVEADVAGISRTEPCLPPRAVVYIVAVPGLEKGTTVAFVIYADQGVAEAAPKETLEKIARSLRRH
ncbi:hypothetical protein Arub01_09200 [Actinomadura rubrobrunea]|uniref:DUF8017 domain-containing protein n=1 Tax=Actinomadura rubrobrunea TaxID=115335 RepID=A0A9W6PTF5_9ACTN|nr:hypothetical protein [Actinomadura rubrobrunea]GLW62676.1 hypothetical protein Arub01_09200 [Actinomadura rubrobrunea]